MDNNLKPCPFCGASATIRKSTVYLDVIYFAECTKCRAKVRWFFVGHPTIEHGMLAEKTRYTEDQAIQEATKAWNRRADDGRD